MDSREDLRTHSTEEGKGETAGCTEAVRPAPNTESDSAGQSSLSRLTELAQEDSSRQFSSIAHLLTPEALQEAFASLRKQAGAGVDEVTYRDYQQHATQNIRQLWERLKSQTYRAQPLRRVYIPKEDGTQRAISIPALEDKIVQKATVRLLNAIFEVDFLSGSYGSRPGRNAHQALDELDRRILCFGALFLDQRKRLLEFRELCKGTIDAVTVHPREVVRDALASNAYCTILVRSDPAGDVIFSMLDAMLWRRVSEALNVVNIATLDYMLVGARVVSCAEEGWINTKNEFSSGLQATIGGSMKQATYGPTPML